MLLVMFMKKIMILLSIFLLTGCSTYDQYKLPEEAIIKSENKSYEVFSTINLYDLIDETNMEILTKDKVIEINEIGEFKETIKLKYENREYKYDLTYKVVDSKPPVYISAASVRTVKVNDDVYLCDGIVFGDNYDKIPTCEIEGDYDLTTSGTYNVKYVIKDSSNNENKKNLKINVVDSISSNNNNNNSNKVTLPIDKVISEKKNDSTMIGIDVSRWQENIDFERVKNAGVEFVIMRMGINSDIDKDISVDSYYANNIKNAKAAGLKVGIYVYTSAINKEMAIEHAKWTLEILDGEKLDFPIAYDWENWSKFRKYQISIYDLDETFNIFADALKNGGYDTMLYSSKFYLENIWINNNKYPVWLAHYTNQTNYEGDYFLWQMSNVGRVDGISGDVDIDILYKNKTSLFD